MTSVPLADLKIVKGEENLTLYQWNTMVAKHYFCRSCGIYTHHQRRTDPGEFAVNVACLDGPDPTVQTKIEVLDGASNTLVDKTREPNGDE